MLGAIALAGICTSANGQTGVSRSVDRAQLLRNQPPTLRDPSAGNASSGDSAAPASPNDADLGEQAILKRADEYLPWTVAVGVPISYTSNVALVPQGEKSDVIFTPNVAVIYAPKLTRTLYANFSIGQQMFYYDRFDALNFGSFDATAGLTYNVPRLHDLILRANYAYNRLTDDSFNEFFSSHSINLGAEVPFHFGRAQQLSVGLDNSFNLAADPSGPGRNEYSLFAAYSVALARSFSINAVFRLAVRDYTDIDRVDVSEIFALSATYRFTKWLSLSAIATYANNDSSRDVFDYQVGNGGGALALTFHF